MAALGDALSLRFRSQLSILAHVTRHPQRYAAAVGRARSLIEEFMNGGAVVDSSLSSDLDSSAVQAVVVRTVVQGDGDVQLIIGRSLRELSAERQFEVLEDHFKAVAIRLTPLARVAELTAALRAATSLIAALGLVGSGAFHLSDAGGLWALGAVVSSTLLLVFPSVAPKLLWWWIKWRIARSARMG